MRHFSSSVEGGQLQYPTSRGLGVERVAFSDVRRGRRHPPDALHARSVIRKIATGIFRWVPTTVFVAGSHPVLL